MRKLNKTLLVAAGNRAEFGPNGQRWVELQVLFLLYPERTGAWSPWHASGPNHRPLTKSSVPSVDRRRAESSGTGCKWGGWTQPGGRS